MTELMWFIYLAAVLPPFASAVGFALVMASVISVAIYGFWWIHHAEVKGNRPNFNLIKASAFMMVLASFTNLVPNSDTIYLMAGAKGAEVAVESEVGQEILEDIQEVIKFQLEKLKTEG